MLQGVHNMDISELMKMMGKGGGNPLASILPQILSAQSNNNNNNTNTSSNSTVNFSKDNVASDDDVNYTIKSIND